jgi:UDP-glucose 4-epimerase
MQDTKSSQSVLVVGGAGYIGSACVVALLDDGHVVVVYDNLSTGQKDKVDSRAKLVVGDILDEKTLAELFLGHRFDAVFHFAAKKAVGESEDDPSLYFKNNVSGTINILSLMHTHNVPTIIFSSTAAVYAPSDVDPIFTEGSPVGAISVYGQSKALSEKIIHDFARTGKIKLYSILRYFNVSGDAGLRFKEKNAQNVFPLLAGAIAEGKAFTIFGDTHDTHDGTCVRDYIHLKDLVKAHLLALKSNESHVYNIGTSQGYSVKELVDAFEKVTGKKMNVVVGPPRKGDAVRVLADSKKATTLLGWEAEHTLEDMVQSTWDSYIDKK